MNLVLKQYQLQNYQLQNTVATYELTGIGQI